MELGPANDYELLSMNYADLGYSGLLVWATWLSRQAECQYGSRAAKPCPPEQPVANNYGLLSMNYATLGYNGLLVWATWLSRQAERQHGSRA